MEFTKYKKLQEDGSSWSFGNAWGDQMEEAILLYLKDVPKNSMILDLGCGEGRGLLALKALGFTNLFGLDISTPKVEKAQEAGLDVKLGDFNKLSYPIDNIFDYLFCSHAIEHSLEPDVVIKNSVRIARNGLFITPIDDKDQPPLGKSPHTYNFYNNAQWVKLFEENCGDVSYSFEFKKRIGDEVWTRWAK